MNKKRKLKNFNVICLDQEEIKEIDGGTLDPWTWMAIGYVCSEIVNGIQDGMQGDCPCEN